MIPKNITKAHVIKAIEEVKKLEVPKNRVSHKYHLQHNGEYYPPKYIISVANKYANGKELDTNDFGGGSETNRFLENLGFTIEVHTPRKRNIPVRSAGKSKRKALSKNHTERCPKCKETIKRLLEKIYGKVEQNYKFDIGTHPNDFKNLPLYHELKEIYKSLQNNRGFSDFIKTKNLPRCDFFAPDKGQIIEFDETQHFTNPREIALENYPEKLELGFNKERWIELCKNTKAKDNDPPYRDEQRAWYDTLRDFLPAIKGIKPTIRLYAKDHIWCAFDPDNSGDIQKFTNILSGVKTKWNIEVKVGENPSIARIVLTDNWEGNLTKAKQLLENVSEQCPKGKKVDFLITCGGFITFEWPESISPEDILDNKNPSNNVVDELLTHAEKSVKSVVDGKLYKKLSEVTNYITLGVDSVKDKISTSQNYISQPHIEFVFLIDLEKKHFHWTGKSYPTPNQQKGLVRIADIKTHFVDLDVGKVMMLACHDLTIFNPRSKNAKGWKRKVNDEFKKLAGKEKPVFVLHHPHTTVTKRTWLNSWSNLRNTLSSVQNYAGAGRYYEYDRDISKWDALDSVLKYTKYGDTVDFICS